MCAAPAKFNECTYYSTTNMSAPRAPRKSTGCVDVQLAEFEMDLRHLLELRMVPLIDNEFWEETDAFSDEDNRMIAEVIDGSFTDLMHRYENSRSVMDILEHCRILIQNVVWASMNLPRPHDDDADAYMMAVIDNAMAVYIRVIYANLRTEMIMANHNAQVLQRTWRRCITDPSHLACRRRLVREWNDLETAVSL